MKRARSHRGSFIREAENYDLANYPSVWGHWRYDETSGLTLREEKNGMSITMPQDDGYGGEINYGVADGLPAYSVGWRWHNVTTGEKVTGNGTYDIIPNNKYAICMLVFRSINDPSDAAAGNTTYCAGSSSVGFTYFGTVHAVHYGFKDINGRTLESNIVPAVNTAIAVGNDYVLMTIYRPAGENCELVAYNPDGTIAYQDTSLYHDPDPSIALADIQPENNGPISKAYIGAYVAGTGDPWYQKTLYVLSTDLTATERKAMAMWHLATARTGIKGPYPALKYRS